MPFSKSRVANSTATGGLSKTEEKTAQKYRKMKKMGLPEGAILHKMIADGIPAHIRDNVMAGGEAPQTSRGTSAMGRVQSKSKAGGSQSSLSSQEEKIAAQYRRMLRIKMPRGAVSHKMIADGVSQKIQDSVMNGDVPQASSSPPTSSSRGGATGPVSSLSKADEKIAASYRKMVRMKMPEGAVRHKMNADGVPQHIQDSVLGGEVPSTTSSSSSPPSSPGGTAGPISSLSKGDEKVAAQYRKMMRMKMPEGAVRHKMNADGVAQHIQDSVLAREVPNHGSEGGASAPPMRRPVNPMAAAINKSGGIGSLKKAPKNEPNGGRPPSNPTAALISGGMGSLKKTSVNEKKPAASSNPLLAAINASGGRSGLKKTPPKASNSSTHTSSSGNSLLDELSAKGFGSSLKKTPPKKVARPQPKSSFIFSVGDELSSDGVMNRSSQSTRMSSYPSPDVSSSSDEDGFGIEVSLPTPEPEVAAPISRRYAGLKIKGVRPTGTSRVEGSSERTSHAPIPKERASRYSGTSKSSFPKDRPSRFTSRATTVTPAGTVQVNELALRKSCGTNQDYRPATRTYASKAKAVRPVPQAEEPPETSKSAFKAYSPKRSPGRSHRFAGQPEEQRQSNGSFESTSPRRETRQSNGSIISMIQEDKPPRSTSSTAHTSSTIGTLDARLLEKDFEKAVRDSIRTQTTKTADMSGRSVSRSKHYKSEWNNDRLARRHKRTITTSDGVDHHCNCTIM